MRVQLPALCFSALLFIILFINGDVSPHFQVRLSAEMEDPVFHSSLSAGEHLSGPDLITEGESRSEFNPHCHQTAPKLTAVDEPLASAPSLWSDFRYINSGTSFSNQL